MNESEYIVKFRCCWPTYILKISWMLISNEKAIHCWSLIDIDFLRNYYLNQPIYIPKKKRKRKNGMPKKIAWRDYHVWHQLPNSHFVAGYLSVLHVCVLHFLSYWCNAFFSFTLHSANRFNVSILGEKNLWYSAKKGVFFYFSAKCLLFCNFSIFFSFWLLRI